MQGGKRFFAARPPGCAHAARLAMHLLPWGMTSRSCIHARNASVCRATSASARTDSAARDACVSRPLAALLSSRSKQTAPATSAQAGSTVRGSPTYRPPSATSAPRASTARAPASRAIRTSSPPAHATEIGLREPLSQSSSSIIAGMPPTRAAASSGARTCGSPPRCRSRPRSSRYESASSPHLANPHHGARLPQGVPSARSASCTAAVEPTPAARRSPFPLARACPPRARCGTAGASFSPSPRVFGGGERAAHLPDDLRFAEHERVEGGNDPEQMLHRARPLLHDECPVELPHPYPHPTALRRRVSTMARTPLGQPADDVRLGLIARREDDGLRTPRRSPAGARGCDRRKRLLAAQLDAGGLMANAHDHERHRPSPARAGRFASAYTASAVEPLACAQALSTPRSPKRPRAPGALRLRRRPCANARGRAPRPAST